MKTKNAFRQRQEYLARLKKYQPLPRYESVFLGDADGNVSVEGRSGYSCVRDWNGETEEVFNDTGCQNWGMPVLVGVSPIDPRHRRVIGPDDVFGVPQQTGVKNHHEIHAPYGRDPLRIWPEQFMPWLVYPTGSMTVKIYRGPCLASSGCLPPSTENLNLSSYRPTSGARWGLLEVLSDGTLNVVSGSVVARKALLTGASVPAASPNGWAFAAVALYAGQHEVIKTKFRTDVLDLRFGNGGAGGGGGTGGDFVTEAPIDDSVYGRSNRSWVRVNEPEVYWPEYTFSRNDFTHDQVSPLGNKIGTSLYDHLTLNLAETPILQLFGGAQMYFWVRLPSNYKTIVKDRATATLITGSILIDGTSPIRNYHNAYCVAHFRASVSATHTFTFRLAGGIKVWFDGSLVVDSWSPADETVERTLTYDASLTIGQTFLVRIEYYNVNVVPLLDCTVHAPGYADWTLGGGEGHYVNTGHGTTLVADDDPYYQLPGDFAGKTVPLQMALSDISAPAGTSITWEFQHGGSGFIPVSSGQVILVNGSEPFCWRYTLNSTFGDYTPTINSIGFYIAAHAPDSGIQSVVAGTNITVDNTDPANPVVSSTTSPTTTAENDFQVGGVGGTLGTWVTKTLAQTKTILGIVASYVHPNHSGDVTSVGDGAQTIAAKAVTLAKMDDMATASLIYRKTALAGAPEVNSLATLKTDLGLGLLDLITQQTDTLAPTGWIPAQIWSKAVVSVVTTKLRIVLSASANLNYYWRGIKVALGATSLTVNSTADKAEGIWYCYSTDGTTFILSQTPFYIFDMVSGAIRADLMAWEFYWDNTNNVALWIQPEFHASTWNRSVHGYAHEAFGTRYANGLDISYGLTAANNDTRIKLTNGEIHDEDISVYITHSATPTANWEQILGSVGTADANFAALPIFYRSGADASNLWRKTTATSYPFQPVTNNLLYYNRNNAGTWDYTTPISTSNFAVYWIVATGDQSEPVVVIPGRLDNANLTAAQAELFPSLATLFTEYKLLYRIIYEAKNANSNNGKCKIISVTDYRKDALANNASVTVAPSAAQVSFTPTGNVAAANVQAAIEELDTEKAALAGSSIQTFDVAGAAGVLQAVRASQIQLQSLIAYNTSGTSTAYTITTFGIPVGLIIRERWNLKFHVTAGATPTLDRDGQGAKALKYYNSAGVKTACGATTIITDMIADVVYDGTDYVVMLPLFYSHPNHSGDVASTGDGATVIGAGKVTLAMLANMATASVVYRKTGGAGAPEVNTLATLKTDLAYTAADVGAFAADADNQGNIGKKSRTIANGAVYSFTPPSNTGFLLVAVLTTAYKVNVAIASYRCASSSHMVNMGTLGANVVLTTGVLTAGTGAAGKLSISCHTDDKIYLENELGGTINVNVTVL